MYDPSDENETHETDAGTTMQQQQQKKRRNMSSSDSY